MSDENTANLNRRLVELTNYVNRELCPLLDQKFGGVNEDIEKLEGAVFGLEAEGEIPGKEGFESRLNKLVEEVKGFNERLEKIEHSLKIRNGIKDKKND